MFDYKNQFEVKSWTQHNFNNINERHDMNMKPNYHKFDHLVTRGENMVHNDPQYNHLENSRVLMLDMFYELKAHGLNAYKHASIKKTSSKWIFSAPSLNFEKEFLKTECANTYQARFEGWLSYLNERGLLNNFGAVECAYNADK
jgi:hypothetical protein